MPWQPLNHEQLRECVCLLCFGKTKEMRKITPAQRQVIDQHLMEGYDHEDRRLPSALCGNCRTIVQKYASGDFSKTIEIFDYSEVGNGPPMPTRSASACTCLLCKVGRSNYTNAAQIQLPARDKPGRPLGATADRHESGHLSYVDVSPQTTHRTERVSMCSYCLTPLRKGKSHLCTRTSRHANLSQLCSLDSGSNSDLKIASTILKDNTTAMNSQELSLPLSGGGHGLKIVIKPEQNQKPTVLSAENVSKIQVDMNLTMNQTRKLATHIRSANQSRHSIEPNLQRKLMAKSHQLDEHFTVTTVDFTENDKSTASGYIAKPAHTVYCHDLTSFIDAVMEYRDLTEAEIKISVDGGGGFLKVCLSVMEKNFEPDRYTRSKYKDGVASRRLKSTGVKKLFIVGISPNVQEQYSNILKMWTLLKINDNDFFAHRIATDLKLANILLGLMSHSSTHPCTWCDQKKTDLHSKGTLRTLGNIREKFWNWHSSNGTTSNAKLYGNVVHLPILQGADDTLVVDVLPPPELHLLLGPMNTIYKVIEKEWPGVNEWAKACHVEREAYHGGSFNGNSCKKLLSKVDLLASISPIQIAKYIPVLRNFAKVVSSCYGEILHDDYIDAINHFKYSYLDAGISPTPKVHSIFYHIQDFCSRKNSALGLWSEQAGEAVHSDFKETWKKFKVCTGHPNYPKQLLRAIQEYNSKHA